MNETLVAVGLWWAIPGLWIVGTAVYAGVKSVAVS